MSIPQFNIPERKRTEVRGMGLLFGWTVRENSKLQGRGVNFYRAKTKWGKIQNGFNPGLTYVAVVRTTLVATKLFNSTIIICLKLLFALYCDFWHIFRRFLILNLIRLHVAWATYDKSRQERTRFRLFCFLHLIAFRQG